MIVDLRSQLENERQRQTSSVRKSNFNHRQSAINPSSFRVFSRLSWLELRVETMANGPLENPSNWPPPFAPVRNSS
jgi:hypothetical protein